MARPGCTRSRARGPLAVIGERDWAPHTAVLDSLARLLQAPGFIQVSDSV
jgi:hypothetical protein